MLSQVIWWSSIVLAVLVLLRGLQTKLALRYPVFYAYVAYVLFVDDISSYLIKRSFPAYYSYVYWTTEFIAVILGCGVVLEIYRMGLARFPGTAKMARNALAIIFILAAAEAIAVAAGNPEWWLKANTLEIERVLRTVQAVAVTALAALCLFYSIPFRKNLRGILLGYGIFVGVLAVCLTFVPPRGHNFWWFAYSACYPVALAIWLAHLWSSKVHDHTDDDTGNHGSGGSYHRLAASTRRALQAARAQLFKGARL